MHLSLIFILFFILIKMNLDQGASLSDQGTVVGDAYSVLHIVAYSPIFKESVTQIKCATY